MANDIKIQWDYTTYQGDFKYENNDLVRENGLETAVIISLFTNRRANDDDELDDIDDKQGWWGDLTSDIEDDQIGSRLWLLNRAKTTKENEVKAENYIREALQWMIDDGVAMKIDVIIERFGPAGNDRLGFQVVIYKIDGTTEAFKFDDLWKNQFDT